MQDIKEKSIDEQRSIVREKVIDILVDQLGLDNSEVSGASRIVDDLGADSLDVVDVVSTVEDEFGVKIPESKFESMATVEDVVNAIVEE